EDSRVLAWHDITLDVGVGENVVDVGLASWPTQLYAPRCKVTARELEARAERHCVVTAAAHLSVTPQRDMGVDAHPFDRLARMPTESRLYLERTSEESPS